jgi:hypothetical protein
MLEGCDRASLPLETGAKLGYSEEGAWQELQSDIALEARIARVHDYGHAASSDLFNDLVSS